MTSERAASDELEFLRADFARIMDDSPLLVSVTQGGKVVYANARLLKALGKTLPEAIGTDASLAVRDPAMREKGRARSQRAEGGEAQPPQLFEGQLATGQRVW